MTTSDPTPDGDPSLQALPAARPASGSGGPASLVALRPPTDPPPLGEWAADSRERKHTVGVLAVALGFLGVHKFLLGYRFAGTVVLLLSLVTCGGIGWVIGLIDGVLLLKMSDEEFHRVHIVGRRSWF
ncbi:MAG: TM2 domain-containing protein [Phycisphaerae bacterium]|jgi:TM2 domain-containing membrane protein YozV|nr:TM2 domain-containing protein [Phycisphaerae bacterium]